MTAILTDRLLSPRADSPAAACFSLRRAPRRPLDDTAGALKTIWSVTCEGLLLLWMLSVVALSLIMAAGAIGFLG